METIGARIKQKRLELDLSQEELAAKVGYKHRSAINKIEMDGRQLRSSKIEAFAQALDTTPAFLMGWDEPDQEPLSKSLLGDLESLDLIDRAKVEAFVAGLLQSDKYGIDGPAEA